MVPASVFIALAVAVVLVPIAVLCVVVAILWVRTRNLRWRVADLENAVRRRVEERPQHGAATSSGSTGIRE
jgi:hypothetical protein